MRDMVVLINLDNNACCTLARVLRSEHYYCKVLPASTTAEQLREQEALGIILSGGVTGEPAAIPALEELLACRLPVLALGDAALTLCLQLGGEVSEIAGVNTVRDVRFSGEAILLRDVQGGERYLPACRYMRLPGAAALASDKDGALGFALPDRALYALAFQPELHDQDAFQLIINFCRNICGSTMWWNNQTFISRAVEEISRIADGGEALCALSGGIDSAVCAALGNQALGHHLHCIFIDTGLMRSGEGDEVMDIFQNQMGLNIKRIDASAEVMELLRGVIGTEEKQRAVFAHLRSILRREAAQTPGVRLILQGTNFADTLDASYRPVQLGAAESHVRIIEPVRELFKDEIRSVGASLALPAAICQRQPFPASGMALRIMADVTREKLSILRAADAIFRSEIEAAGLNKRLFQYYASLCDNPIPDEGYLIILRAVQIVGGGEAAVAARLPSDLLERANTRICAQVPSVRRVMYDLTTSRSFSQWRSD